MLWNQPVANEFMFNFGSQNVEANFGFSFLNTNQDVKNSSNLRAKIVIFVSPNIVISIVP